ncbi:hypothetical protein [Rhodanobacter sp. C06]|uniref:hypothetical protein n=1 Tax=Rhodanobacter sp. C06 TaxID=1945854 RepID=UPI001115961C|nr:hypothetical protein [Rhodanobacter sp. C06]
MAVPDWVSYVSLAGGVIGTVSGCMAYRRTGRMKALDLRLELRKTDKDLRDLIGGLGDFLQQANASRQSLVAASGTFRSGSMQGWRIELEADLARIKELEAALPPADANYKGHSSERLESLLVDRHVLQTEAMKLRDKYEAAMKRDDKDREQIARIRSSFRHPGV